MIMQEVRKMRFVHDGSGVHGGVALSRHETRLGHARTLLHAMESRLATTFDTSFDASQIATSETRLETRQPIRAVQEKYEAASADMQAGEHPGQAGASRHRLLRCLELGGVHEICSLGLIPSWPGISHETAGARRDRQAMLGEGHGSVLGATTMDTASTPHVVAPYAVLMFLAQWIASKHDGSDKSGGPCHVAWIGDRVQPDPGAFRAIPRLKHLSHHAWRGAHRRDGPDGRAGELGQHGEDGAHDLASRSFFVRDSDRAFTPVRHGHLARNASARRTNAARLEMDARACNRLWCAEQAIRMDAAGVLIVDGTGFSPLAWRRLQLAVDAFDVASDGAMEADGRPKSPARDGLHRKPCVLVVVPFDRRGQSAGCAATARWSVHAAAPDGISPMDSGRKNSAVANTCRIAGFAWRLEMVSARRFGLQALAHGGEDSRGEGGIEIVMSRSTESARAEQCWSEVAERAAGRRRARAMHHVLQAPVDVGMREADDPCTTLGTGVLATFTARAEPAIETVNEDVTEDVTADVTADMLGGVRAWRARSA